MTRQSIPRELRKIGGHTAKRARDFTDEERAVVRTRRQHQDAAELAAVFGTTSQVIAAICREGE